MEIHILLEGEQLGPFSEIQVRQYLGEGLVSPSDLATYEGMQEWQSLDQILTNLANLPAPEAPESETILPDVPPSEPPTTVVPVFRAVPPEALLSEPLETEEPASEMISPDVPPSEPPAPADP